MSMCVSVGVIVCECAMCCVERNRQYCKWQWSCDVEADVDRLDDDQFGEIAVWLFYIWSWIGLNILLWKIIQVKLALIFMMRTANQILLALSIF